MVEGQQRGTTQSGSGGGVILQPLKLFTTTQFDPVHLILNSKLENTPDGKFTHYTLANLDLISITDDDLTLQPIEIIEKYLRLTSGIDGWLFVATIKELKELKIPIKTIFQTPSVDVLCINLQTGQRDISPEEWFTFDLRAQFQAIRQENLYLKARDVEKTRQLYMTQQELNLLSTELDNFGRIANNLQLLVAENRMQVLKYSETAYQQMERARQMKARLDASSEIIQEYYDFRKTELPKLLKSMTKIVKEVSGMFKEYEVFMGKVHTMTKEDVINWKKEMEEHLDNTKKEIDENMRSLLTKTEEEIVKIKDTEQGTGGTAVGGATT